MVIKNSLRMNKISLNSNGLVEASTLFTSFLQKVDPDQARGEFFFFFFGGSGALGIGFGT